MSLKDWDVYRYCQLFHNLPEKQLDKIFEEELFHFYMSKFGKLPINRNNNAYIKMSDADCVTFFHAVSARLTKHQLISTTAYTLRCLLYLAVVVWFIYIFAY